MTATPALSILLPVRDAAATLPACLRSIARQTESDWECVAVDDGSRDASPELLRRAAAADPRFRVERLPRVGIVAALNRGLELGRAPLVARMDADDVMHRERLALQRAALARQPGWAGVGCHVRCFPRSALGPGMRAYERWILGIDTPARVRREAFVECPLVHPTLVLRAELLREQRYRDRGWPEDYDLLLRLLAAGHTLGVVPRRLLGWRHRATRLSHTSERYTPQRMSACKAEFLARGFLAASPHYVLWGYGRTGRILQRALRGRGRRPSAIVELHPGRIGQSIHGAPVIPPAALRERRREPLIVSVAGAGPRAEIRAALGSLSRVEGRDFVCAA